MTENEKLISNLVIQSLDNIYLASEKVAKSMEVQWVNTGYLYAIIQKSKQPVKAVPALMIRHNRKFNILIAKIMAVCKNKAVEIGANHVPLQFLKNCIEIVKKAYLE